jgi:hypothetical protein
MKTQISETQLDNATHALAGYLNSININLGDDSLSTLNDTLNAFLNEHCLVNTISDEEAHDDSVVLIRKERQVSCNADEDITYQIDKVLWEGALLEADGDAEEALLELQTQLKVTRLEYDCEVKEINAEFDVNVEEA